MGKKILLVSTYFSIFLLVYALYKEQKFLYNSSLLYVDSSAASFLHALIILSILLFFTTFITFIYDKNKYKRYVFIGNYCLLFFIQILCLVYGSSTISSSIKRIGDEWGKLNSNKYTAEAETILECCGFHDVLEASSYRCSFTNTCGEFIKESETYRKLRFLLIVCISLVFQVYHVYIIFQYKLFFGSQASSSVIHHTSVASI